MPSDKDTKGKPRAYNRGSLFFVKYNLIIETKVQEINS